MSGVQFLFLIPFYFAPINDKIEGNYATYLVQKKIVITLCNEQIESVVDIAKHEHFTVLGTGTNTILLELPKCEDAKLHLMRLSGDAAIDAIKPLPSSFPDPAIHQGAIVSGKQ